MQDWGDFVAQDEPGAGGSGLIEAHAGGDSCCGPLSILIHCQVRFGEMGRAVRSFRITRHEGLGTALE